MKLVRRIDPTATALAIAAALLLYFGAGCALFSQPANLTPQEKRTMQIGAVEETFTSAVKAANDLYEIDKVITQDQLKSLTPVIKATQETIRFAKAANSSGDLDDYEGRLRAARTGIDQLQRWLQGITARR